MDRQPFDEYDDPAAGARCVGYMLIYLAAVLVVTFVVAAW